MSTPEISSLVKNKLTNAIAILKLIEDRDGPQALDKPGGADLVSYTTYENAAGVVRNMLEDLYNEIKMRCGHSVGDVRSLGVTDLGWEA
jgi:hypothetical protein